MHFLLLADWLNLNRRHLLCLASVGYFIFLLYLFFETDIQPIKYSFVNWLLNLMCHLSHWLTKHLIFYHRFGVWRVQSPPLGGEHTSVYCKFHSVFQCQRTSDLFRKKLAYKLSSSSRVCFDVMVTIAMSKALVFFLYESFFFLTKVFTRRLIFSYISPSRSADRRYAVRNSASNHDNVGGTQPSVWRSRSTDHVITLLTLFTVNTNFLTTFVIWWLFLASRQLNYLSFLFF